MVRDEEHRASLRSIHMSKVVYRGTNCGEKILYKKLEKRKVIGGRFEWEDK